MISEQVSRIIDNLINMSNCYWSEVFDDPSRKNLEVGNIGIASTSAFLSFWVLVTIFCSNLRSDLSYRNLGFYFFASFIRCFISVLLYLSVFKCNESLTVGEFSCNYIGFLESFLSVYEVECLTHVCIERYVVAKYIVNGWEIQKNHYGLYQLLCVLFSLAYSLPPLIGLGKYEMDFSCNGCVLDMALPETWDRYVVIIVYLLRSVKSTGFMITMLIWAHQREAKYNNSKNIVRLSRFTQNVIVVTSVNLFFWLPITVIRGWTILSFWLYSHMNEVPSTSWIQWAMWMQWMAPLISVLAMFSLDDTLRRKMKIIFQSSDEQESTKNE